MEHTNRLYNCCFTGHRPEKLHTPEKEVKTQLRKAIRQAIEDGFTTFLSGMARGVDMWAAEVVLREKKTNKFIELICVVPFAGFESRWTLAERCRYHRILKKADRVEIVCDHYSKSCFQIRNCYMVDHSSRVIAVYNGEKGGTGNTIRYAIGKHIEVINIFKGIPHFDPKTTQSTDCSVEKTK